MQRRSKTVHFRIHQTEWDALQRLAKLDARTPSEALRELIRSEAQRRGVWMVESHPDDGILWEEQV